ncbi:SOSS complex subunit C homolog [Anastrepha obliqua]|uniref:SOSS complex subunit C homolog n=1 Tax=Anastrepha ludens TaxID=28586 RepID=UPI0023AEBCF6|nr:SOSS complex subunit C homolog [Anastrepha ludens]XP_054735038.1 SOSS complex subunit C homolog [Anastrepha obliqua]
MANFPTLGAQQETNRKILEDLQLKKQLLQKGNIPGLGGGISTNTLYQIPASQLLQSSDFSQSSGLANAPRSVFNATTSTTLGFFVSQDSYYGNTFIPVLPRLDPPPPMN